MFMLTNKYIFSKQEFALPVKMSYGVKFMQDTPANSEFHPCWSKNKKPWGQDSDALSWFFATHRQDFTFRTEMFGGFPNCKRPHGGFKAEIGKRYKFYAEIYEDRATYSIDGQEYASCTYEVGKVPKTGHVGFGIYAGNEVKAIDEVVVEAIQVNPVGNGSTNIGGQAIINAIEGSVGFEKVIDIKATYGDADITEKLIKMYR